MSFILVLVASGKSSLSAGHLAEIENFIEKERLGLIGAPQWLRPHHAADINIHDKPDIDQIKALRNFLKKDAIDIFSIPAQNRRKKLLLADMDGTIVTTETLDEIAAYAGTKDKVSAITERAMCGEIDFKTALKERVALLSGLPETTLNEVLAQTELTDGAETLIGIMAQAGATCVLVSGGFTFFTDAIAAKAGFHYHHGNVIETQNGILSGTVTEPILDKNKKLDFLTDYRRRLDLKPEDTIAIGDGANDLPMLLEAGLGIGYRPKPLLLETLDNCIIHSDLSAALYIQGFRHESVLP